MTYTPNGLNHKSQITDVSHFFFLIIEKYRYFERDVLQIISKVPLYPPQQIFDECNNLKEKREKLESMEKQMFDIIELAGNEIAKTSLFHDYRIALAKANMACNNLHQALQALKVSLQTEEALAGIDECR